MKEAILRAAAMLLVSVLLVNVTWYGWRAEKYRPYIAGMEPQVFYTALDPSYYAVDAEGYTFSVAYPDYLSATGNLCVGTPMGGGWQPVYRCAHHLAAHGRRLCLRAAAV